MNGPENENVGPCACASAAAAAAAACFSLFFLPGPRRFGGPAKYWHATPRLAQFKQSGWPSHLSFRSAHEKSDRQSSTLALRYDAYHCEDDTHYGRRGMPSPFSFPSSPGLVQAVL